MEPIGDILNRVLPSLGIKTCPCCGDAHTSPRTICNRCARELETQELQMGTCRRCGSHELLGPSDECSHCELR